MITDLCNFMLYFTTLGIPFFAKKCWFYIYIYIFFVRIIVVTCTKCSFSNVKLRSYLALHVILIHSNSLYLFKCGWVCLVVRGWRAGRVCVCVCVSKDCFVAIEPTDRHVVVTRDSTKEDFFFFFFHTVVCNAWSEHGFYPLRWNENTPLSREFPSFIQQISYG